VLALALAGCGGNERAADPEGVVRAWSDALTADDNERAASLFDRDAVVVQGSVATHLRTHEEALRWNARLPCSGKIVALKAKGSAVTATFRLADRRSRPCADPRGAEAVAVLVVEDGKIVLWDQIGSQIAVAH
jgi:hypothetical protein